MSYSARGKSADACRAERVESFGGLLASIYAAARLLDRKAAEVTKEQIGVALQDAAYAFERWKAAAAEEGDRSREALHGEDSGDAQVIDTSYSQERWP